MLKFGVVPLSQPRLDLFVVRDLLFVFSGGLGMKPITHLKSA